MTIHKPTLGFDFGNAICEHFGLPGGQVSVDLQFQCAGPDILTLTIPIYITAEDIQAIGLRMVEKRGQAPSAPALPPGRDRVPAKRVSLDEAVAELNAVLRGAK